MTETGSDESSSLDSWDRKVLCNDLGIDKKYYKVLPTNNFDREAFKE
jgi:hypothetical protein